MNLPAPKNSESSLQVRVYTPRPRGISPIRQTVGIIADFWRFRELVWVLFLRDLKAQYRQSYLGYVWAVLPITATTLAWIFLNSAQIVEVSTPQAPYPIFVFMGALTWNAFSMSVTQPIASFISNKDVFMKLNVPTEAFLLSGLAQVAFNVAIQASLFVPLSLIYTYAPASTAWLFPIGVICSMLIGVSVGLVALPFGVLYSDVSRVITLLLGFAMLLSPVAYPVPETGVGNAIMQLNPMSYVIVATRDCVITGDTSRVAQLLVITGLSVVFSLAGLFLIRTAMPRLVERMGM